MSQGYNLTHSIKSPTFAPGVWTDYTSSSNIVGWGNPNGKIFYKVLDDLVFVKYDIAGTSNDVETTFTVPFTSGAYNSSIFVANMFKDNGGAYGVGFSSLPQSSTVVVFYAGPFPTGWTASHEKEIYGEFWYKKT